MPLALEKKLRAEARKKFPHDRKRQDEYVFGTLRKTGWKPARKRKKK